MGACPHVLKHIALARVASQRRGMLHHNSLPSGCLAAAPSAATLRDATCKTVDSHSACACVEMANEPQNLLTTSIDRDLRVTRCIGHRGTDSMHLASCKAASASAPHSTARAPAPHVSPPTALSSTAPPLHPPPGTFPPGPWRAR